jgi:hypothetical protein
MGLVLYVVLTGLESLLPQEGVGVVVSLIVELTVGGGVFAWSCSLLGAPELWEVASLLRRRGG